MMAGSQIPLLQLTGWRQTGGLSPRAAAPWLVPAVPCLCRNGPGMPSGSLSGASASSRGRWEISNAVQNLRIFSDRSKEMRGKVCPVSCYPLSSLPRTPLGLGREENAENLSFTSHHQDLVPCYAVASQTMSYMQFCIPASKKTQQKTNPKQEILNGAKVRQARKINKRKLFSGQQGADLNREFMHGFERRLEKQLEN